MIGVSPKPKDNEKRKERLNLFAGRSLSDIDLQREQDFRASHLACLGQTLSPGVVTGLEVLLNASGKLEISPGSGITIWGEDVVIPKALRVNVADLPQRDSNGSLQPLAPSTEANILVIEPIVLEDRAGLDTDYVCEQERPDYAFDDRQRVDGSRLVLYPWPQSLTLPDRASDPINWRNRLAYSIFKSEVLNHRSLSQLQSLPWENRGVPIALIGFDSQGSPIFVDRNAVVRAGGRPRQRSPLVERAGTPFLWQARIQQFSEQWAGLESAETESRLSRSNLFKFLPPVGRLPADFLEITWAGNSEDTHKTIHSIAQNFFPDTFKIQVYPVPLEQVDLVVKRSASLDPFDLDATEDEVHILLPIPQPLFDPNLLQTEILNDDLETHIKDLEVRVSKWLKRRKIVREILSFLHQVIQGIPLTFNDWGECEGETIAKDMICREVPLLAEYESSYNTSLKGKGRISLDFEALKKSLKNEQHLDFTETEICWLEKVGLEAVVRFLENKLQKAEDHEYPGHIRLGPSLYRIEPCQLGVLTTNKARLISVKDRLEAYRCALELIRKVLKKLRLYFQNASERLTVISNELNHTRYELSIAQSQLADAKEQVARTNNQRQESLKNIPFLVFCRPRAIDLRLNVPVRQLTYKPAEIQSEAVLQADEKIPAELQEALEPLCQGPLIWLTSVVPLLDEFAQIESLTRLLRLAKDRAQRSQIDAPRLAQLPEQGPLGAAIYDTFLAQQAVVTPFRDKTAEVDLGAFSGLSWQDLRSKALTLLSLSDLLDINHRHSQVALKASQELENIAQVITALYIRVGEVPSALRVKWANGLAKFDPAIQLRNLSSLPDWGKVNFQARQEMQSLVDWLYQRIHPNEPEASDLIRDLIRISILLASLVPINGISSGQVSQATHLNIGSQVPITVSPAKVRIGMQALILNQQNQVVAEGEVVNFLGNQAIARVTQTLQTNTTLTQNSRVRFIEPRRFRQVSQ